MGQIPLVTEKDDDEDDQEVGLDRKEKIARSKLVTVQWMRAFDDVDVLVTPEEWQLPSHPPSMLVYARMQGLRFFVTWRFLTHVLGFLGDFAIAFTPPPEKAPEKVVPLRGIGAKSGAGGSHAPPATPNTPGFPAGVRTPVMGRGSGNIIRVDPVASPVIGRRPGASGHYDIKHGGGLSNASLPTINPALTPQNVPTGITPVPTSRTNANRSSALSSTTTTQTTTTMVTAATHPTASTSAAASPPKPAAPAKLFLMKLDVQLSRVEFIVPKSSNSPEAMTARMGTMT
jgi:hypothetical protein